MIADIIPLVLPILTAYVTWSVKRRLLLALAISALIFVSGFAALILVFAASGGFPGGYMLQLLLQAVAAMIVLFSIRKPSSDNER